MWSVDPWAAGMDDQQNIYGRGTQDMKAREGDLAPPPGFPAPNACLVKWIEAFTTSDRDNPGRPAERTRTSWLRAGHLPTLSHHLFASLDSPQSVCIQYMESLGRLLKAGHKFLRTIHLLYVPGEIRRPIGKDADICLPTALLFSNH